MHFFILGNEVEYQQASKRLEQISEAKPNTPEAHEYKDLILSFLKFERDIRQNNAALLPKN